MLMYMPNMNSLASTTWPGVLYTETDANSDADTDNNDDDEALLH